MKTNYYVLIVFPFLLKYSWQLVKFLLWPLIKLAANKYLSRHNLLGKNTPTKEVKTMTNTIGIKEFKEALAPVIDVALALVAAKLDDGKINTADLPKFLPSVMEIPAAIEGGTMIPTELKDFHSEDFEELKAFVIEKAKNVPGIEAKWMKVVSGALKIIDGGLEIADAFRG